MKRDRLFGIFRGLLITTLLCVLPSSAVAKTTDLSDLWWIPSESGWGIQFVEEETTIFATMFIYGSNGQPTWYTALLEENNPLQWSGALYATTGPWFGTVPFDPAQVTIAPVGTMTFNVSFIDLGTLTYTVNGVQVIKHIQRESLVNLNFNGTYDGALSERGSGSLSCSPSANGSAVPATIQITQNGAAMSVVTSTPDDTCTVTGTYAQGGHFGQVDGSYTCTSGDSGAGHMSEMAVSWYDVRARTELDSRSGCVLTGYVDGLLQPSPPQ